jgi:alpha-glucoside transport system substrate-binding protein
VEGRSRLRPALGAVVAALAASIVSGCAVGGPGGVATPAQQNLSGSHLQVLAVWSGVEQQRFERVLRAFERETGASVTYASAGYSVPATLQTRLAAGRPPDIAFLPQPSLLRTYAREHLLVPLDGAAVAAVDSNYDPMWRRLGSVDGKLYGVWFKAANKSLIWYNEGVFERLGVVPPADLNGLITIADKITAAGTPAFSVGGANGWTLTDWFANLYLRIAGPARYDLLAQHRIPWTDPSVKATLRVLATVLAPAVIAGGPRGALAVTYQESVVQTFAAHPAAAMVFEGDFVGSVVDGMTQARLGVDADVFPFPAIGRSGPMVVAGGDAAVLMRPSRAGEAFIRYLASPQAAAIWAEQGGYVSPNVNLDISVYPDAISRSIARGMLEVGSNVRFGLSDLEPAAFGGTEGQGMRKILQDFLVSRDVTATATRLEAAAAKAFASRPATSAQRAVGTQRDLGSRP